MRRSFLGVAIADDRAYETDKSAEERENKSDNGYRIVLRRRCLLRRSGILRLRRFLRRGVAHSSATEGAENSIVVYLLSAVITKLFYILLVRLLYNYYNIYVRLCQVV